MVALCNSDGGYIGIYTLPKSVPDQLLCALIAADVVRLLVYIEL